MANKYMTNFIAMNTANPQNIVSSAGSVMIRNAMFAASKVVVDGANYINKERRLDEVYGTMTQQDIDDAWDYLGQVRRLHERKLSENATMRTNLSNNERDAQAYFNEKMMMVRERQIRGMQRGFDDYNNRGLFSIRKRR